MLNKIIAGVLCLASLATVGCAADKKVYFPLRIDHNHDYPGARVKGGSNWQTITWRGVVVNNYDFAPNRRGREKFLAETKANRERLAKEVAQLHAKGIKVQLHEYEIYTHGVGAKLATREERKKFLENKLYEMMKLCPWLDGYIMTTSESSRPAKEAEDIKAYVLGAWAGIKRANDEDGKKRVLMVRSWLSGQGKGRIARITEYFPFSTDKEIAKNIYIVTKQQHGDFNMRLPINPLVGRVGDHPQIVAFDVTVNEYRAYAWYPCGMAHEWSARFRELAKIPGLVGLNPHIQNVAELEKKTGGFKNRGQIREWRDEDVKWTPWNHLNVYIFYALANNPFKDPREIYIEWATKVYGAPAAKPLADILTMSSDVMFTVVGPSHSGYAPARSRYYYSPLEMILVRKKSMHGGVFIDFDHDVTAEMIAKRQAPIDNALKICDRMIEILETNKSKFKPDDYKRIHADLIGYKKYAEVNKICTIGTLRYVYALKLKGSQKKEQLDAVEKLVQRGLELYEMQGNFYYKTGHTGYKSYINTVRELQTAVKAERSGKPIRIFPERIAQSLKPLEYKPDAIAHVGGHLYILGENKIHKLSVKGKQLAVSKPLPFEARALSNDGNGGLLICAKNAVYRLVADKIKTAAPVKWKALPKSLKHPDAIAYDPKTRCLFVGDNRLRKIVQINPEGKIIAAVNVPAFQAKRRIRTKKIRGLTFRNGYLYAIESYAEGPFLQGNRWVYKLRKYKPAPPTTKLKPVPEDIVFNVAEHLDAVTAHDNPAKAFLQPPNTKYHLKDNLWGIHARKGRVPTLCSACEKAPVLKIAVPVSKPGSYDIYLRTGRRLKYSLDGKTWKTHSDRHNQRPVKRVRVNEKVFNLYIDGDTSDWKSASYLVSVTLKTPDKLRFTKLKSVDIWHLAMGRRPYGLGLVEDVCFDASGNAWVISPTQPLPNRVYRVELQE